LQDGDRHDGWVGKTIASLEDLLHTILPCKWGPKLDVILLLSGTLDFFLGSKTSFDSAPERVLSLIRKISSRRPGVPIVLGKHCTKNALWAP